MWEVVLFHLALLLCARQVVRRREGESNKGGGVAERQFCRKRKMEKQNEERGKGLTGPSAVRHIKSNNCRCVLFRFYLSLQL